MNRRTLVLGAAPALVAAPASALCVPPETLAENPQDQAFRLWDEFHAAMDRLALEAGADGWTVYGGHIRKAAGREDQAWFQPGITTYVRNGRGAVSKRRSGVRD
ncbi:hypothetical protein [Ancylobacter terrae]|uniref:hypothetical protein n=1 Tax=Ancylobacter sp. sgz301288 TaxID=3342077 RepID=UPI00385EA9C5